MEGKAQEEETRQEGVSAPRSLIVEKAVSKGVEVINVHHVEKRVLIADDHHDGAEMMRLLLAQNGHDVCVAHCGADALELARREKPQIAVLDIGMPDINGYEVATRIRAEAWGSDITLIAVTGWGRKTTNAGPRRRASISTSPNPSIRTCSPA